MNNEMAYLLGMICGNGEIQRGNFDTIVSIDIPHKKLETEFMQDVQIYVKASVADIKNILEPLLGTHLSFIQKQTSTILSFRKPNNDYLIREILRYIGNGTSHSNIRLHHDIFNFTRDEKIQFLRGFSDVTGYIRRSNYFFDKYKHRVYLEVPNNWYLVVDICNLLYDLDIPVQNIDWGHPNMRDSKLKKYNSGNPNFWKKEHQIKIWANEFLPIGFEVLHKMDALNIYSEELINGLKSNGKNPDKYTHRYYWETRQSYTKREDHPGIHDDFIPQEIRGINFNSWKEIAKELGYPND